MSREGTLVKNTAIITIGKICTQMVSFFLLPIYTALLSTEEYGTVDLLNTLVSLLLPIITLQIENAIFRYLIDNRENNEQKKIIISTSLGIIILQCISYIILFLLISKFIHNDYKFFLATNVIASIFSSIMLQISRGLGDNTAYALGSFVSAASNIVFNIIFIVIFKFGAYGMLTANFLGNVACVILVFFRDKVYQYTDFKKFDRDVLKKLWKYSIPMVPNALSWWIFNSSDRVIVTNILGIAANGIIAVSNKFSAVFITIYNIFNITWTETASLHINDSDRDEFFSRIINTVLKLFSAICFGIIGCMPFIFNIMVNKQYVDAYNYIPIYMIAALGNVGVGLLSAIYIAKKDSKAVAKTSIFAAVINIIVHLMLISKVQLYAASISTLVAYYIMFVYRLIDVRKYNIKIILEKKLVIYIIALSVITMILYYINNIIGNVINLIIVIIYAIGINIKSINFIKNMVLKRIKGDKDLA